MSEPRFDSLYSAWATIAGGTGYDSTYSAMKAALEKVTGQENYDSVYSMAADFANDVESGSASVAKNTQLNEEITENGTYTFTPDEGYVYDSVTVSVDAGSKAEGTIKIVNNGTYDVTSYAQANVAVGGESYSYKVNQVDEAGLRAIGWDDESIGYFRDNFGGIYPWEADSYKVSDANKALVDKTISEVKASPDLVYCPNNKILSSFAECKYLIAVPGGSMAMNGASGQFRNCINLRTIPPISMRNQSSTGNMFNGCKSLINIPLLDTSGVTDMQGMFYGCTSLHSIPLFDTSNVANMYRMFSSCSSLSNIPPLDTSNVTNMQEMFYGCVTLKSIPPLDTSKVTNMYNMFYNCASLYTIPSLNVSNVSNLRNMFAACTGLKKIPDLNFVKTSNFGGSYSTDSWLYTCKGIVEIGVIDCDSMTNITGAFGESGQNYLTDLGGFRNLGKASTVSNTDGNYFLYYAPNLTYESVMNVLNLLYDRASAGLSVLTLKLHPNHLAMLSEDDIAVATNKGWTLV